MATNNHDKPTVCISFISPGEVTHEFTSSLLSMMRYYSEKGRKVIRAQVDLQSGPRISEARSQVVDAFAKTNCNWLLMIDSDMGWDEDALDKLLETADMNEAPIVGGLCFGGRADSAMFPTIYGLVETDYGFATEVVHDYPRDAVVKVGATGAAFMLVHKWVFKAMREQFGTLPNGNPNPYPWFVEASNGGYPYGEDISFCIRANALGIPVHVDTRVKISHRKHRYLTERSYDQQQQAMVDTTTTPKADLLLP